MKRQGTSTGWAYTLLSMMLIGFALTLIGCKGGQTVTETVRTEYVDRYIRDTVHIKDMVWLADSVREAVTDARRDCVVIVMDADSNVISTSQWHSRDTERELSHDTKKVDSTAYYRSLTDSLRRMKKDSVYSEKVVEKELTLWQKTKQTFGGYAILIVAAAIIYLTWYIKRKDRQNI